MADELKKVELFINDLPFTESIFTPIFKQILLNGGDDDSIEESNKKLMETMDRIGKVDLIDQFKKVCRVIRNVLQEFPTPENQKFDTKIFGWIIEIEEYFKDFISKMETHYNDQTKGD